MKLDGHETASVPKFIRPFEEVRLSDVSLVGGKNASLGELISELANEGIAVPSGFVITADAYSRVLAEHGVRDKLDVLLKNVNKDDIEQLSALGQQARTLIKKAGIPEDLREEICAAYRRMEARYGADVDVAVRSSATAEDLPDASFAGQQESFLNVRGELALLEACSNCFASLFTNRAISYRVDKGFDQLSIRLSIGVQKMVRSDLATAGVIFTLDPESGFRNAILVTGAYGLGENLVAGRLDPDEYLVFKPTLKTHPRPIIRKKMGAKQLRMIYSAHGSRTTKNVTVSPEDRQRYCLSDEDVLYLARAALKIEEHYRQLSGNDSAMDIEWAKDGQDGLIYIVQARPETVHSQKEANRISTYALEEAGSVLLTGRAIGQRIGSGRTRIISSVQELDSFQEGEVLVTDMTDPDWEPVMKRAGAIITNSGGRTCHAAIISRELGVPCIVGTSNATTSLKNGTPVTVFCGDGAEGIVYDGILHYKVTEIQLDLVAQTKTRVMVNLGNPELAFTIGMLPIDGVGLARQEFIIANEVKVHPLALTRYEQLTDRKVQAEVDKLTQDYAKREDYFVDKLAQGVSMIAAAFYPRPVIVRLSDFKTNEYANLLGGKQFEPEEENPMIGFRGACRYYSERYRDGFELECRALLKSRAEMGLTNIKIMVPFCRTRQEGELVLAEMARNGLARGEDGLEVYAMCELPSNVFCMNDFAEIFDGFSIGSNDLTQLILGLDRDSSIVAPLFDERNPAVLQAISLAIQGAHRHGKTIGICGQAPSDYPEFIEFLLAEGIDSISLNADVALQTKAAVAAQEKQNDSQGTSTLSLTLM